MKLCTAEEIFGVEPNTASPKSCNQKLFVDAHELGHKCFKVEYSLLSQLQSMFLFANTTTTNVTGRTKDYVTKHSLLNRPMRCLHFDKVYWVTGTETRLCRDSETTTKIVNFVVTYWIYYNKVGHAK